MQVIQSFLYRILSWVAVILRNDLSKTTLSIYPNPVRELLIYMINGESLDAILMITDVLKRVVYSQKSSFGEGINHFTILTAEYREGMCFFRIINANTNQFISLHQFVKVHSEKIKDRWIIHLLALFLYLV